MIINDRFRDQLKAFSIRLTAQQEQQLDQYNDLLITANRQFNLTSITEPQEVLEKHFLDCLSIVKLFPADQFERKFQKAIDVGTGAGFPGMVLAIAFPETSFTLSDSLMKRVKFLEETAEAIGLKNVAAVHARAEDLGREPLYREKYDLCVSRAVAALPVLCEYCLPFVKTGGIFTAYKSVKAEEELASARTAIHLLGGEPGRLESFELPDTDYGRSLIAIRKIREISRKYPRKAGVPAKNPLG